MFYSTRTRSLSYKKIITNYNMPVSVFVTYKQFIMSFVMLNAIMVSVIAPR